MVDKALLVCESLELLTSMKKSWRFYLGNNLVGYRRFVFLFVGVEYVL